MRWIWPLSWYFEMRELRAQIRYLEERNRELDAKLRAAAFAQTASWAAVSAAVASIASTVSQARDFPEGS